MMPKRAAKKFLRELFRIGRQLRSVPVYLSDFFFSTHYYDLILSRKRKTLDGEFELKDRVAIFLFYPRKGLLDSHLRSISYLAQAGYAPLVICNAPLDDDDIQKVLKLSWRYIERPNFGYDFGGYRDGVLSIKSELKSLDRLILTNDSTWFPLPGAIDWIAASEALDVDYAGAAWAWGVKHEDPDNYEKIEWNVNKDRRNFHYASYALNIANPILKKPGFYKFWKNLRLTNHKNRTVRRGEIGLTSWVLKRGFTHGATTELTQFDQILKSKTDDEILSIIENLIFVTDSDMRGVANDFVTNAKKAGEWRRASAEKLIMNAVARQGASYSVMMELVENHGFAFMKKSPAFHNDGIEKVFKNVLGKTCAEFQNEVLHEIQIGK